LQITIYIPSDFRSERDSLLSQHGRSMSKEKGGDLFRRRREVVKVSSPVLLKSLKVCHVPSSDSGEQSRDLASDSGLGKIEGRDGAEKEQGCRECGSLHILHAGFVPFLYSDMYKPGVSRFTPLINEYILEDALDLKPLTR
jgi:hypothetical protein